MGTRQAQILVKGNEAIALGAVAAGCECYFAYPITPQSEIPEMLSQILVEAGGAFVQAESEIAAANMLLGATACGKRAMTSSSSPGIALKQEAISYMAGSQLPGVIVNICRGGPGLGSIDPSQGDYYQTTRGGGHGDYRTLTLAPASCQEAYDLTIRAFDLAFAYRNPVVVLGDAILGQMKEPITDWKTREILDSTRFSWSLSGANEREPRLLKSLYLSDGALAGHIRILQEKYQAMKAECDWEAYRVEDAELIVVAFGSMGRIAKSSVRKLRDKGQKVGLFRPITLYPFPAEPLNSLAAQGKRFLTLENNAGQMVDDVRLAVRHYADSGLHCVLPGHLANPDDLLLPIENSLPNEGSAKKHHQL